MSGSDIIGTLDSLNIMQTRQYPFYHYWTFIDWVYLASIITVAALLFRSLYKNRITANDRNFINIAKNEVIKDE